MKHLATTLALTLIAGAAFASGSGPSSGGGGGTSSMGQRDPHTEAVNYHNSGERQLEKATKAHDELKASTDPSQSEKLKGRMNKALENAAADFQRAVKADPNLYQAYSELGFCLRKLGKYDESLAAYDKALAIEPRFSPAIEYRAEAYLGLNRIDDAKNAYTLLFQGDRMRADLLFAAMKQWVADHRADPQAEGFAKWVDERASIHAQTSAVSTASREGIRSW
jgi:tetratricopeptide (TPR) repeat protein